MAESGGQAARPSQSLFGPYPLPPSAAAFMAQVETENELNADELASMRTAFEKQNGPAAVDEPVVGHMNAAGIIEEWNLPWKCMIRIFQREIETGRPLFFPTMTVAQSCRWPQIKTTKTLQNMVGDVRFQMSRHQRVVIPAKFVLMAPKDRALLTGDEVMEWHAASERLIRDDIPRRYKDYLKSEIRRYDPRLQQSRSRTWSKYMAEDRPSWIKLETIRCCEMGIIPVEVEKKITSEYSYYLNEKLFFDTSDDVIIAPDLTRIPIRMLPVPSSTTQIEQDLVFWRAHGSWPTKGGNNKDRLIAANMSLLQITNELTDARKKNDDLRDKVKIGEDERRELKKVVAEYEAKQSQYEDWRKDSERLAVLQAECEHLQTAMKETQNNAQEEVKRAEEDANTKLREVEGRAKAAERRLMMKAGSVGFAVGVFGSQVMIKMWEGLVVLCGWLFHELGELVTTVKNALRAFGLLLVALGRTLTDE
ncbi:hypothetical protein GL218_03555 [Daldinia childiae]|uniref:uncharacterized protein n=1 Tax=Daldinia childiae TaxID=326645 RepID=UPI001447E124|nr:uncharacterized protein GL218_03555 [Daldinia childiae]KAF3061914.1 hypothetical protein GL218_03555 [Daldinia childiae]